MTYYTAHKNKRPKTIVIPRRSKGFIGFDTGLGYDVILVVRDKKGRRKILANQIY